MHTNYYVSSYSDENFEYAQKPKPETQYARAYVPFQEMRELYSPAKGLKAGTVFPELDQPYCKK